MLNSKLKSVSVVATIAILCIALYGMLTAFTIIKKQPMLEQITKNFASFFKENKNERLYIKTDKTYYKPGETIWFSVFVREDESLKASDISEIVHVEFLNPKGAIDKHIKLVVENGIAKGDLNLTGYLGGIFTIKAYTTYQKNDDNILLAEKEITIQSVVMPRVKMKLDFDKKAYGKGDKVVADLVFTDNTNNSIANQNIDGNVNIDGNTSLSSNSKTDATGKVKIEFTLPKDLNSIDVLANFKIKHEGSIESISRSVPVVLNKISIAFYPEGGDMIDGVAGKVAFSAKNEFEKSADVEGYIFDDNNEVITKFSSFHNGIGSFDLAPQSGMHYFAKITKPEGISTIFNLPDALKNGYSLAAKSISKENISLSVFSFKQDTLSIVAQTRGKVYHSQSFSALKGVNNLNISTQKFPVGISQITLFDSKGIARAERLAFVNQTKQLSIKITPDKAQYRPNEKVTLNIRTLDEEGLPVSGDLALSVVDDNLLSFADDKQGNILSKMLLEPELKEKVEEPNFYFDTKEPKAAQALDNLMLTAGWRRYTWKQRNTLSPVEKPYKAEVAKIKGKVINFQGNPLAGAKITLLPSKKSTTTDKDGNFMSPSFHLLDDKEFEVSMNGFITSKQAVYNYENEYYISLRKEGDPIYYMSEAAGGGRMQMRGARNKNLAINDMAMEADMVQMPMEAMAEGIDMAPLPKDEEKVDNVYKLIPDEVIEREEVGDLRDAEMKKKEKVIVKGAVFYRGKEFPKREPKEIQNEERSDLGSTAFWAGHISTDQSGKARIEFYTNDVISSFKAIAEGFGENGEIGRTEATYITNIPLVLDAKIPTELTSGDIMMMPVFLKNNTDQTIEGTLSIKLPSSFQTKVTLDRKVKILAQQSELISIPVEATSVIGTSSIQIQFKGNYNDLLTRTVTVVAKGFPTNTSLSGQDVSKTFFIEPKNVVKGSMKVTFNAFPNVMTELLKGVEAILREPYGCFEQTSSSNYPNIMALSYMRKMKIADPKFEERALKLLDDGYKKLTSFETKENGFEWFGAAPAHEALTAYGLMQFEDMKEVYPKIDEQMIERTRKLILNKRDGNGGFVRNPRALDSFGGADEDITNAYIVYGLTESGYKDLAKEMDALFESAKKSKDPYILALAANAFYNLKDYKRGNEIMQWLLKEQSDFGHWTGKKHSITRSTGDALKIETTSLAGLAIMKADAPNQVALQNGIKYLVGLRNGFGNFGSTQSTVLALKVLTKYAEFSKKTEESGTVEIYKNDKLIATKAYEKGLKENIAIDGLEAFINEGKQKIEIKFKGCKNALPYSMNMSYHTTQPSSSKECVLDLSTNLSSSSTKVGETVRLNVSLKNKTALGQPMSLVIIGIPAGLSVQPWQLKELQDKKVFDFYEVIGSNIAIYYRALAPSVNKTILLDLKADVSGKYEGAASSAYLYYTNEHKTWNKGLGVNVD
jgi:hypothetical protein